MSSNVMETKKAENVSKKRSPYMQNSPPQESSKVKKVDPLEVIWRIRRSPESLNKDDMAILQNSIGNKATMKLISEAKKAKEKNEKDKSKDVKEQPKKQGNHEGQTKVESHIEEGKKNEIKETKVENSETKVNNEGKIKGKEDVKKANNSETKPSKEINPEKDKNSKDVKADKAEKGTKAKTKDNQEKNKPKEESDNSENEKKVAGLKAKIMEIGSSKEENGGEHKEGKTIEAKEDKEQSSKAEEAAQKSNKTEVKGKDNKGAVQGALEKEPAKKNVVKIKGEDPGKILDQLSTIPPDQIYGAFAQAEAVSGGALQKQMNKSQSVVPTIPTPTGIKSGIGGGKAGKKVKKISRNVEAGFKSEKAGGKAYTGNTGEFHGGSGEEANPEVVMAEAKKHAANAPSISMSGEADPSQISGFKSESSKSVNVAQKAELNQINNEFGENNIVPQPDKSIIKAQKSAQAVTLPNVEVDHMKYISPEVANRMNPSLSNILKAQLEARNREYSKGRSKFDSDVVSAKDSTNSNIEQMKEEAREKQVNQQAEAKAEVSTLRGQWRNEVNGAVAEYDTKADSASQQKKQEIGNIKQEKEGQVKNTMADAEKDANKEYKNAKSKAEDKKKESSGGVIGWIKDKAEKAISAIKSVINSIFDGLRKAVKFIFEKAKKVAMGIIEAGRKLIVNVIKGLGKVLKALVKTVFAKFPAIANRICNKIDSVVNRAVKLVNQTAALLKKGVSKALDMLAKTVDKLIAGVQNLYNKAFSAINKFLKGGFKEIFMKALEAAQIAAEIALAFATGGGSILAQIVVWLGTTLPGLLNTVGSVIGFVSNLKNMNLSELKEKFTPGKMGDVMVQGIFGELRGLPQGEKEKEKEQEPSGGKESKGLRKVIQAIASVFKVVMGLYGKVASGLNKILGKINITTKPWFASFSMGYAAAMKAVEAVKNPGNELGEGVGKVREVIGEFFGSIKGKLTEVSNGIRDKLGILGNPAQLMKTLANKAVDMVLNFIITHPPSALIKAAFKAVEAVADKPIIDLIRQHIPFADKLINKIAESGPVQGLLKPLQKPVNQLGGVIDKVSGGAVKIVDQSQQTAMGMFGSGSKLLKDMGGSKSASGEKSKGGPDFIGSVKSGIHSRLMSYGEMNLLKSGKKLAKGAVNKAKGMILGLKKFMIGSESHELWVEKRGNKNVLMMASDNPKEVSEIIKEVSVNVANIKDETIKKSIQKVRRNLNVIEGQSPTDEIVVKKIDDTVEPIKPVYEVLKKATEATVIKNWKGDEVKIPEGHIMSPRDPDFSQPPIIDPGPYTTQQYEQFLKGNSAGTKLSPHHRHQIPIRDGGVMDEIPGPGHPSGNQHTKGSPSRHPGKSVFNHEPNGNKLRMEEIVEHWKNKGKRLTQVEPEVWYDPGV